MATNPPSGIRARQPRTGYNAASDVDFVYAQRTVVFHHVLASELDTISSGGSSLSLSFLGMTFGALLTLGTTLWTGTPLDEKTHANFVALTWAAGILTIFFAIGAAYAWFKSKAYLKKIKTRMPA